MTEQDGTTKKRRTVKKAAEELGIAHTTLYRWIDKGTVKPWMSKGGVMMIPDKVFLDLQEEIAEIKAANDGVLPKAQKVGVEANKRRQRQRGGS